MGARRVGRGGHGDVGRQRWQERGLGWLAGAQHPDRGRPVRRASGGAGSPPACGSATRYGAAGKIEEQVRDMSLKDWENKVVSSPGAAGRVAAVEDELRLAAGLTALREEAGLSQRELARRIGVSQPPVAAIERSRNGTPEVLPGY